MVKGQLGKVRLFIKGGQTNIKRYLESEGSVVGSIAWSSKSGKKKATPAEPGQVEVSS